MMRALDDEILARKAEAEAQRKEARKQVRPTRRAVMSRGAIGIG